MAVTAWSSFYPYILPEVPGVPEPLLDHVIRNAAIDFCEETGVQYIDAAPINVVAGTAKYAIDTADVELDCSVVKFAWLENQPLPFVPQDMLNDQTGVYWPDQEADRPTGFTQDDQTHIILYPKPKLSITGGLKMKLVVRPSLTSTGVTDWVANRFIQEIAYGALSMLAGMVGKSWSNPEAEAKYRAAFEAGKTRATIDANRSFTRAPLRLGLSRF